MTKRPTTKTTCPGTPATEASVPDSWRGFAGRVAGFEYLMLCLATFLCFTTLSQTALLSVILADQGVSQPSIGWVLSSYGIAVTVFSLLSGVAAARFGALPTLRLGMVILLAAHLSYYLTVPSVAATMVSRILQGIGFGLFLASAMTYAKSKLTHERFVHLLGIYASMVQLPNAVGPPLGKMYLDAFGSHWFFIVGAIPAVLAVGLTFFMREPVCGTSEERKLSLLKTALLPQLRLPLLAIMVGGAMLGLVSSYLAPLLIAKQVPLAMFFTVFPITAFTSRFVLLGVFEAWSRRAVLILGFACMATAYALLVVVTHPAVVALTAILFGLGSSVSYPMLSAWVSEQFKAEQRATPVAIFNTAFNFGLFATPLCAGYLIALGGYDLVLAVLAVASFAVSARLFFERRDAAV